MASGASSAPPSGTVDHTAQPASEVPSGPTSAGAPGSARRVGEVHTRPHGGTGRPAARHVQARSTASSTVSASLCPPRDNLIPLSGIGLCDRRSSTRGRTELADQVGTAAWEAPRRRRPPGRSQPGGTAASNISLLARDPAQHATGCDGRSPRAPESRRGDTIPSSGSARVGQAPHAVCTNSRPIGDQRLLY